MEIIIKEIKYPFARYERLFNRQKDTFLDEGTIRRLTSQQLQKLPLQ